MTQKSKLSKRMLLGTTTALMLLSQPAFANTLKDLEQQKSSLNSQMDNSQSRKTELQKQLNLLEVDITTLEKEIVRLNNLITETDSKISVKMSSIKATEQEIIKIKKEIAVLEADLEVKKEQLRQNLKIMYSKGDVEFLEFLFRSDSVSQFIYRYDFMKDVVSQGEVLHNQILEQKKKIESQKKNLEDKKAQIESEKRELEGYKLEQENQKKQQQAVQHELNKRKNHVQNEIDDEEAAMTLLSNSIVQAERAISTEKSRIAEAKRIAEEKRRLAEQKEAQERAARESAAQNNQNNQSATSSPAPKQSDYSKPSSQGSGIIGVPVAKGTYRISSGFGYRIDPVYGTKGAFHNGLDFAASIGTPIYAAEEGYVLFAGPARGYGHWVVIKHPSGLYTIYGHMYGNQIRVSPGEYVLKGQRIAAVGSDGKSTGAHLHFSTATSFNGGTFTYKNPLNYVNP